ncbi:GxxExxY protein [Shumkonia mesophila]|uniref:GxxExxY protein n=1 Tax=Shumkonia mesophila TaxID=2838854 RepID=UPI002934201A|nr:GxxExxY protein [Shumkonia mesophila]
MENDPLTEKIIGAAIEVHRHLGPGLLESAYQECLCQELARGGLTVKRQVVLPIAYKGVQVEPGFRVDMIVEDNVLLELKAVERILPIHEAQVLTYLKLSGIRTGLLMNFNAMPLKNGIKRFVV